MDRLTMRAARRQAITQFPKAPQRVRATGTGLDRHESRVGVRLT